MGGSAAPPAPRACDRATTRSLESTISSLPLLAGLRSATENSDISSLVSINGASS